MYYCYYSLLSVGNFHLDLSRQNFHPCEMIFLCRGKRLPLNINSHNGDRIDRLCFEFIRLTAGGVAFLKFQPPESTRSLALEGGHVVSVRMGTERTPPTGWRVKHGPSHSRQILQTVDVDILHRMNATLFTDYFKSNGILCRPIKDIVLPLDHVH